MSLHLLVGPLNLPLRQRDLAANSLQLWVFALARNHIILLSDIDDIFLQLDDATVIRGLLGPRISDRSLEYIQLAPQDVCLFVDLDLLLPEFLASVNLGRDSTSIYRFIRRATVRCQ